MRRSTALGMLVAFFLVTGCGGDVVSATPSSQTALAEEECSLAPGEDPCDRDFGLPPEQHEAFVSGAALITMFAGEARELALSLREACDGIVVDLGGPPSREAELAAAVADACARARKLLGPAVAFERTVAPASCTEKHLPACLPMAGRAFAPPAVCTGASVVVAIPPGSQPDVVAAARALDRHGGAFHSVEPRLERLGSFAQLFAQDPGRLVHGCPSTLVPMIGTATREIEASVAAAASLTK